MMDEILDQVVTKSFDYCAKEENIQHFEEKFLNPIIQHISRRFIWLSYSFQTIAILVVLQTLLIVYLVFMLRSIKSQ